MGGRRPGARRHAPTHRHARVRTHTHTHPNIWGKNKLQRPFLPIPQPWNVITPPPGQATLLSATSLALRRLIRAAQSPAGIAWRPWLCSLGPEHPASLRGLGASLNPSLIQGYLPQLPGALGFCGRASRASLDGVAGGGVSERGSRPPDFLPNCYTGRPMQGSFG